MSARILIVDDSAYARRMLKNLLETNGFSVTEANTGMSGIESYFLNKPDVVLLDLTMEDMTGVEVLTRLKEMDAGARVIVISADVQSTTEDVVLKAGAIRFLGKPAPGDTILAAVKSAMEDTP